jgi:XTP/dITP diphosphohydrolase
MNIVLASHNLGKLNELRALLGELDCTLVGQTDMKVASLPEPHCTFIENALLKARHAAKRTGLPAIADDAGLCIDALGGLPGVDTATYCTQFDWPLSDENNVRAILETMKDQENRCANLFCILVALRHWQDPQPLIAQGCITGILTKEPLGTQGFGFDPILWIPSIGKTLAQLNSVEKNAISHRGQATTLLLEQLTTRWCIPLKSECS